VLPLAVSASDEPVSFYREVAPILKENCQGCHRPGKSKGGLDLSSFAALSHGGKNGPALDPKDPRLARSSNPSPAMSRRCRRKANL
jgi:mono/diheme cytochrome c family protein